MTDIKLLLTPDIRKSPDLMASHLEAGTLTPEDAICTTMAILYGGGAKAAMRIAHMRGFWEARLSGRVFKDGLLENAAKNGMPLNAIEDSLRRQEAQILADTVQACKRIMVEFPGFWKLLQDSDIVWELPVNLDRLQEDDLDADALEEGFNVKASTRDTATIRERARENRRGNPARELDGKLSWSRADPDYEGYDF